MPEFKGLFPHSPIGTRGGKIDFDFSLGLKPRAKAETSKATATG